MTTAFQMFDPYAFLDARKSERPHQPETPVALATLAALAGAGARTEDTNRSVHGIGTAKAAKPAKVSARPDAIRAWADGVAHLDADRSPQGVPAQRWRQFIYDAARFIDNGLAEQAAALGWDEYDLFGCHPEVPIARLDYAGLVWLLKGDRVIALSENVATIQTRSGARQTWRRRPRQPSRVLAWQLS